MRELAGGVAVVTGAASGIGRALAQQLAAQRMSLALCDVDEEGLQESASRARAADGSGDSSGLLVTTHLVDVGDAKRMEEFAAEVAAKHGRATLLVNNAGVALHGTVEEVSLEEFAWLMRINFWGVVHGVKYFLPMLRGEKQAHIVNMSSIFGIIAPAGQAAYSASKFAIRGFSEALRQELHGSGVGVSCVHPGGIRTGIASSGRVAAKRPGGAAEDVARFAKLARTSPEAAAEKIVEGVKKNRARILIGADAFVLGAAERALPVGYGDLLRMFRG